MFSRVLICGMGLIGGSLAGLIREVYPACAVYGVDTDSETRNLGLKDGLFSDCYPTVSECDIVPDLVFVCVPIHATNTTLEAVLTHFNGPLTVTDVASVKRGIGMDVTRLSAGQYYIPGHPMAGIEKTGLAHANPEILKHANYVLVPSDNAAYSKFKVFVESLSFKVLEMPADAHDEGVALTSHFPFLWASILASLAQDNVQNVRSLMASGFKDTSRVAGSSSEWGRDVLLANADNILDLVGKSREKLDMIEALLKDGDGDGLLQVLSQIRAFRAEV